MLSGNKSGWREREREREREMQAKAVLGAGEGRPRLGTVGGLRRPAGM